MQMATFVILVATFVAITVVAGVVVAKLTSGQR
jgi:hypothetical protein